jgi:hypothetical protein
MTRALFAAALVALLSGVYCTTKDVDYDPDALGETSATSSAGGATSTGSSTDGADAPTCSLTVCTAHTVEKALILGFDAGGAAGASSGSLDSFGDFTTNFSGSIFRYPDSLDSVVEDGAWHLSGNAGQSYGFGISLACQSDASAFSGIEFTLRGSTGDQQINFVIETASNIDDACLGGTCAGNCAATAAAVNHESGEQAYSFVWADLQDGSPDDTPDPSEITAIRWEFQASTPIEVDFYVDDIRFTE